MASFSKLSVFPVGYFRAFSSWLLRNRRDIAAQIITMNAEIERIGFVRVEYRQVQGPDGSRRVTEERLGVFVTPGSTLERLMQAYVAQGGNPLDISPFWIPDDSALVGLNDDQTAVVRQRYPHGGVLAPKSAPANSPVDDPEDTSSYGGHQGGWIESDSYFPARQGGRVDRRDLTMTTAMRQMRDWANQSIKTKLQDIEWRIVKQMDLREQLIKERDEVLVQAFGGALNALPHFDEERFNPDLRVQALVADMYQLLFETDELGVVTAFDVNDQVGFLDFTFEDLPSEVRDPLG